jgi:hypothetical protein
MRKLFLPLLFIAVSCNVLLAQVTDPVITSWIINPGGQVGYNNIPSNCQLVQYATNNVYVSCTCVPGYSIGPWNNPNVAQNQNFVYKITRHPQPQTGAKTAVGMGHIGVLKNGVSLFNVYDGYWWDSTANNWSSTPGPTHHTWNRNALMYEYPSFDNCIGHPQQQGEYHHHVSPKCLYDQTDSTHHSPLIGYSFDGYPIYGAYGYATANNASSGIKRMKSSYVLTTSTTRLNGPPVNSTYPLGNLCEDYIYTNGAGDLDASNGRLCVTPEYPNGTYAYFMTLDASLNPTFPYTFYGSYYGVVPTGNSGPNSGHQTVASTDTVQTYTPSTTGVEELKNQTLDFLVFPNPTNTMLHIFIQPIYSNDFTVELYDIMGRKIISRNNVHPTITESLDVSQVAAGNYVLKIFNSQFTSTKKITISE